MRGITFQQIVFLLLIIFLPMIEAVLKRRRAQRGPRSEGEREGRREEEAWVQGEDDVVVVVEERPAQREGEISYEGVSAEGRSYDDAVEGRLPEPARAEPPPPARLPESVIVRAPAPERKRPVYPRRADAPRLAKPAPLVALAPRVKRRRVPRINATEARRGVVLMEVLGPPVSLRDQGREA